MAGFFCFSICRCKQEPAGKYVLTGIKKDRIERIPIQSLKTVAKLLLSGNDLKVGKFNLLAELPAESLFDGFIAHFIHFDCDHSGAVNGVNGSTVHRFDFRLCIIDGLVAVVDHDSHDSGDDSEEKTAAVEDQNSRINLG